MVGCADFGRTDLVTEVLGGDGENTQAQRRLLQLSLEHLQLQVLQLAALPQLLDQSSVLLLRLLSPSWVRPPPTSRSTGKKTIKGHMEY